jgi:hypothetical protein
VVNAHIIPITATITEVSDSDNDIQVSIYAAVRSRWMVDSGATHHITPYWLDFTSWALAKGAISLSGHAEIQQIGSGKVVTKLVGGDRGIQLTLHDIMHIPEAHVHYFSVGTLLCKGGRILFKNMGFEISMQDHLVAKGYMEDNLFWFDSTNTALNVAN